LQPPSEHGTPKTQEFVSNHNIQETTGVPLFFPIDLLLDVAPGNVPTGLFTIGKDKMEYFGRWVFLGLS
jgi:hypothetical protein